MSSQKKPSKNMSKVGVTNTQDSQLAIIQKEVEDESILNNNFPYASPSPNMKAMK